jgi:putative tryptophan/tyrosine transport system substrate-binding protein
MRRREFITLFGGAAAVWPLTAQAQQAGEVYRIGFLANDPNIPSQSAGKAFVDGLRENGFVEGRNILIDWRFGEGIRERHVEHATALVRLQMDVIVASSNQASFAAKQATKTIPIVLLNVSDPVGFGLVASLASSGGNITGVSQDDAAEIAGKRLQFLKDAVPQAVRIAVLVNSDDLLSQSHWGLLQRVAPSLHVSLDAVAAKTKEDLNSAFARLVADRPDALLLTSSPVYFTHRALIMKRALEARLPTISHYKDATQDGGLMSYGNNRIDNFRRVATYVSKILNGARPSDLPIENPVKYELVINLRTAKALGIELPRQLLLIADEVIE